MEKNFEIYKFHIEIWILDVLPNDVRSHSKRRHFFIVFIYAVSCCVYKLRLSAIYLQNLC